MGNKEKIIRVRIDDYTDEKLRMLEEQYQISRSEIVRRSISMFQNGAVNKMFGTDIVEMLIPFGEAYNAINFGIVGDNYLLGKGFWIDLKANFLIGLTNGFKYGATEISFKGYDVHVEGGFLNDIQNALAILYSSHRN